MAKVRLESIRSLSRDSKRRIAKGLPVVAEEPLEQRPKTRADCINSVRPCPWVGCRHHLFLNVSRNGSIRYAASGDLDELDTMPASCSLDEAEKGGMSMGQVARNLQLSELSARNDLASGACVLRRELSQYQKEL